MEPWMLFVALCSISTGYFIGSSIQTLPTNKVVQLNTDTLKEWKKSFSFLDSVYLFFCTFRLLKFIQARRCATLLNLNLQAQAKDSEELIALV